MENKNTRIPNTRQEELNTPPCDNITTMIRPEYFCVICGANTAKVRNYTGILNAQRAPFTVFTSRLSPSLIHGLCCDPPAPHRTRNPGNPKSAFRSPKNAIFDPPEKGLEKSIK